MKKSKSRGINLYLKLILCFILMFGICLSGAIFIVHAEESYNLPQIIRVGENEVDQEKNMVNMPIGIVKEEYKTTKVVTANDYDKVSIKSYAENIRGCLPKGLVFNAETKEITGIPEKEGSYDVQIYCSNEYGSTSILAWVNIYAQEDKPTLSSEAIPATAYIGSLYSTMIEVRGYNQSFEVTLGGVYPEGMTASRNGIYALIQFKPTPEMAGKTYNFTLCVDNSLGKATKECTIKIANEVESPEFITKLQPLGYSEGNPNGKRAKIGEPFEFWLQAKGTNTKENPLKFFKYDEATAEKAIPNAKGEYDLGNGLFLTEEGLIYSNCVLGYEGEYNGSYNQISFRIGASNKNVYGNEQDTGYGFGYCYITIFKGFMIDSFTISPKSTDIPKGGKRQFTANIEGIGEFDKTVEWTIYGFKTDKNTNIDSNGLLTIGANETCTDLKVIGYVMGNRSAQTEAIKLIDHIHSTHLVEMVDKTCDKDGNIRHYKCDSCDGLFSDVEAINYLTEEQVIIKAGHEFGDLIDQVASTCIATGVEAHYECSECHKLFDESKTEKTIEQLEIKIDESSHDYGSMITEVASTCASEGTKAHKDCLLCGKHFDDTNIEILNIVLSKNDNHDLRTGWVVTPDGHYHECKREGCKDNGKVDYAPHTKDRENADEDNAVKCTECGYIITPALGHMHHLTIVPGKAATCQIEGKKAYYACDGCSLLFEDEAGTKPITSDIETWGIIPMAHKFGEWFEEVTPTKETLGTKAHKDCEFCGKHFDKDGNEITSLTIDKLPSDGDQTGGEITEPREERFSSGVIAGIVVGSIAVVGICSFAIIWFIVKKKTCKELIIAITNIFKKK